MSRYKKISPGVFKDIQAGTYYAVKYVERRKVSKTFNTPSEARSWRSAKKSFTELIDYECEPNGSKPFTFQEAWDKYKKIEHPKLQKSTLEVKEERCKFFDELLDVKMIFITPEFVDDYILKKKETIIKTAKANRYSLKNELIELSAVCGFYQKHMDYRFVNPVIKDRHWPMGVIKEKQKVHKKMSGDEIALFFKAMWELNEDNGVFALLAENQFFTATRVSEAAAFSLSKIDLENKEIVIDSAVSWHQRTKTFAYLKGTKTGATKYSHLSPRLVRNFRLLISRMVPGCDLLHHVDGEPLAYHDIYKAYRRGLKRAGLHKKYSATHIMRHSMAKQARLATGSLDGAQAMGGWKSIKQCEFYADSPSEMQKTAVNAVEQSLRLVQ